MMENSTQLLRQDELIAQVYEQKRDALIGYIYKRIGRRLDAEDIAQNVFVQLLGYTTLLSESTLVNLIYTIARNLTIDYLRRNICSRAASDYFYHTAPRSSSQTEDVIVFNDLQFAESRALDTLSPQRARAYCLAIHDGMSAREIAEICSISTRTAEHHIYIARGLMREELKAFAI